MEFIAEFGPEQAERLIAAAMADIRLHAGLFLIPALTLMLWTAVMWVWMYATRIPGMKKAGLDPQAFADRPGEARAQLPPATQRPAENYNHLHEQPVVFYAVMLVLALVAPESTLATVLAWTYVGLRILHSIVQATVNHIMTRFSLFALASLVLFGLIGLALFEVHTP